MRRLFVIAAIAACSAPAKSPASSSVTEWTSRCAARLEGARTKLALGGATKIDPSPWHPIVRFEVHAGGGYYEAIVSHGRGACIDFDSDDPTFTNLPWSNASFASKVALDRLRRMNGDEASVQADKVPRETIAPFRAAFEGALEACLSDARAVPIGPVPSDIECVDKVDKCPDTKAPGADDDDGCPEK
ncbi:MAG TPA: hypothetical protein VGH87_23780 [Polyangiaceae bacterium]|jgi:hypothetical protein